MSYPKQLLRLTPTKGLASQVDVPPHETGPEYYNAIENVHFRHGFAERIQGHRDAYTTALATAAPGQIMHAVNAERAGTNYWLVFEDDGTAWSIEGTNATQIDNTLLQAVTDPWRHSSALLNGIPLYSNGADEPVYWAGGNLTTLTDWTATESCEFIAVFKYHAFALDISGPGGEFPNLLKWSSAAEPGTIPNSWTPSASNDSGSVELADSPGALLCAYPLRDALLIYKRSSIYSCQYVGGNNIFSFRKVQSASGALTRRSVCDVNGRHLVVQDGDIVLTDGTNRQSIGQARVKDYFFNQIDQDNYLNAFCTYNRAKDEVIIGFPTTGNEYCNLALVYDVGRNAFGVRDLPQVVHAAVGYINDTTVSNNWADRTDTWAEATDKWGTSDVAAATDSMIFAHTTVLEEQDTSDAISLAASVGKYDIDFGLPERVKFLRRVHIQTAPNYGTFRVRVGGKMRPNDATTWSNEVTVTDPEQVVNLFAVGRYLSIEIRSTGSDVWEITSIELEADLRGYF